MTAKVLLTEIITFLGDNIVECFGFKEDFYLSGIASQGSSSQELIDWVHHKNPQPQEHAEKSLSRLIICPSSVEYSADMKAKSKVVICLKDPYCAIAMIGNRFFVERTPPGIHLSAIISDNTIVGKNVRIGANAVLDGCIVGDDCIIGDHVIIRNSVHIGDRATIKSVAILGETGFGFVHDDSGGLIRFPQIGRLLIGNNVEIGSHTCIDRGSFSDTIIEDNVKINNLCHIAHNVRIGSSTIITAHVNISGSTSIGSKVWIGPNATFVGHHKIGNR
ncbi:MAG: hypothetical protein PHG11_08920, partial [Eubacteriales bacterium]|nr:hypothetical protein [Eubacteriales bacterium]